MLFGMCKKKVHSLLLYKCISITFLCYIFMQFNIFCYIVWKLCFVVALQ